jgi:hypothetical protein
VLGEGQIDVGSDLESPRGVPAAVEIIVEIDVASS